MGVRGRWEVGVAVGGMVGVVVEAGTSRGTFEDPGVLGGALGGPEGRVRRGCCEGGTEVGTAGELSVGEGGVVSTLDLSNINVGKES